MGHISLPILPEFLVPLNEKPLRDVLEGISVAVGDLDKRIEDGLARDREGDAQILAEVKALMDSVEDRFSKSIAASVLKAIDGLRSELMEVIREGLAEQNARLDLTDETIALLEARDDRLNRRIDHHDAALQQVNDLAASAHEWIRDTQIDLDLKNAKLIQEASAAASAAAEAAAAVAGAPQSCGNVHLTINSAREDKTAAAAAAAAAAGGGSRSASREAQMMALLSSKQSQFRPKKSNRDKGLNQIAAQSAGKTQSQSSNRPDKGGDGSDAEGSTPAASSPSPDDDGSGSYVSALQDPNWSDFMGQLSEMREHIEENASMIRLLRLLPPRVDDMEDAITALQARCGSSPEASMSPQTAASSLTPNNSSPEEGRPPLSLRSGDVAALSRRMEEAEEGLRAIAKHKAELASALGKLQQELPTKISKQELDKVLAALADALRGEFSQANGEFQAAMRFLRQDFHQAISQVPRLDTALIEANQARLRSQVSAMELDLEDVRKGVLHKHVVQAAGTTNCVSCYNNRSQSPDPRSVAGADGKFYSRLDSDFLGYTAGYGGSSPPPLSAREAQRDRSEAGSPIGFSNAPLSSSAMAPSIPILAKTHMQQEAGLSAFDLQNQRGRKVVSRSAGGSWRGSRPSTAGRPHREVVLARSDALKKEEFGQPAQSYFVQNPANAGRSNSKGN